MKIGIVLLFFIYIARDENWHRLLSFIYIARDASFMPGHRTNVKCRTNVKHHRHVGIEIDSQLIQIRLYLPLSD